MKEIIEEYGGILLAVIVSALLFVVFPHIGQICTGVVDLFAHSLGNRI